jgi:aspartate/tyrosine/aromatic aminotransferase
MFADIDLLPADPILGLSQIFKADPRENKIDLGVGVYRTPDGQTPVMAAVQKAQDALSKNETTKAYTPPDGFPGFTAGIVREILAADNPAIAEDRVASVQTPGGCGALRLSGEVLKRSGAKSLNIGTPTWANHQPLFAASGLPINMLPYYDAANSAIEFDAFLNAIGELGSGDCLLLHACCHNPTGADMSEAQIDEVIDLVKERDVTLIIDMAYHGFARGLENDAYMVRTAAVKLPEVIVTYSCSKNFGLYRERIGALIMIADAPEKAAAVKSHALSIARGIYSMPPAHGGGIVTEILSSDELTALWKDELARMAAHVAENRALLVKKAQATAIGNRFDAITSQYGMFSLLPLTVEDVAKLRDDHGVYLVGAGRINLCGINDDNVDYLVSSIATLY